MKFGKRSCNTISIFVVDDDIEDVNLITRAFKSSAVPYQIQHFVNGEELLNKLDRSASNDDEEPPDLILLDLNMPVTCGREVLAELSSREWFSEIPVIVFTSSRSNEDVEDTVEMGASLFLSKPSSMSGYIRIVKYIETACLDFPESLEN